jgi:hypothetical protein
MRLRDYLDGTPPPVGYSPDQERLIIAKERYHLLAQLAPADIPPKLIEYVNAYRRFCGVPLLSPEEEAAIWQSTNTALSSRSKTTPASPSAPK